MSDVLKIIDDSSLSDLKSFLVRAARVELGAVHLLTIGQVLAATVAVLYPTGLLERRMPTILGMRTFQLAESADIDIVVKQRAILDRIARLKNQSADHPELELPTETVAVSWGGITPPRTDWLFVAEISVESLRHLAEAGIQEISEVIPGELGEARVRRVRGEVWGRLIDSELGLPAEFAVPAGVGFAALSLGFIDRVDRGQLYESGQWLRLSTPFGHVLTRKDSVM